MTPLEQLREAAQAALQYHGLQLTSMPPQDAWTFHNVSERLLAALAATAPESAPGVVVESLNSSEKPAETRMDAHCGGGGQIAPVDAPESLLNTLTQVLRSTGYVTWGQACEQAELIARILPHLAPSQSADQVRDAALEEAALACIGAFTSDVCYIRISALKSLATSSAAKGAASPEAAMQALVEKSQELGLYDSVADALQPEGTKA